MPKRQNCYLVKDTKIKIFSERECLLHSENPVAFHAKSEDRFPKDTVVLSRHGRSFWLTSKQTTEKQEQKQYLEQALDYLTKAIEQDDRGNRFSLTTRLLVRWDLVKISRFGSDEQKHFLQEAKADGRACFKSMPTRGDMNNLAHICQMLAKFPNIYNNGPEAVISKDELYEALDCLHYGDKLGEPVHSFVAYRMALCLFDLGEFEKAIEWQDRIWSMWATKSTSFCLLCVYLVTLMVREGIKNNNISRMFSFFILGENKYGDKEMMDIYCKINKWSKGALLKALKIIVSNLECISIDTREKKILVQCLTSLREEGRGENETCVIKLQDMVQRIIPLPEREEYIMDIFCLPNRSPLPTPPERAFSRQYSFDYFMSYSHADQSFVRSILVPLLEIKFKDHDVPLKGFN